MRAECELRLFVPCGTDIDEHRTYLVRGAVMGYSKKRGGFSGQIYFVDGDCRVLELTAAGQTEATLPELFPGCTVSLDSASESESLTSGCMRVIAVERRRGCAVGYVKLTVA